VADGLEGLGGICLDGEGGCFPCTPSVSASVWAEMG